ncbi:MAG TPA: arsinothricin resistance N-acetyltransferase ArsN1 family A [Bryobacteraceae bacterium]|nr:arsinothricin resistance N-acetyltransferase ArsN1 family A [Bryobacteraceae bacterium]
MTARRATAADAEAIARIYNEGIDDRIATFETRHRSEADVRAWLAGQHIVIAIENGSRVIGFAVTHPYSSRDCYAGIAEFSVYVERASRGRGAGRLAVAEMVRTCEAEGYWKLLGRIFAENTASRTLFESLGFREVGIHERHAQLDGCWRDVVVVERLLGDAARD